MNGPIVVPLDGSRLAEKAIPFAAAVAARSGATLHLVTVHLPAPPPAGDGFDASYDPAWHARTAAGEKEYLDSVAERQRANGLNVVVAVPDGPVVPTLLEYIDRELPSLVVMATHGRSGINRLWLGSTLDRAIREVTVPVLVVPSSAQEDREPSIRRMIIPLDGSELAEEVLEPALTLGGLFDCSYELIQVALMPFAIGSPYGPPSGQVDQDRLRHRVSVAGRYLAELRARLGDPEAGKVTTRVVEAPGQPVADVLLHAAAAADVIALATHGRGGLQRFVLGSVADKLIRSADLPLLVVRPEDVQGRVRG